MVKNHDKLQKDRQISRKILKKTVDNFEKQ